MRCAFLAIATLLLAGTANASLLTIDSNEYVGLVNPGSPAGDEMEVLYINNLTGVAAGTSVDQRPDGGQLYDRTGSDLVPTGGFSDAILDGTSRINFTQAEQDAFETTITVNVAAGVQYIVGKYDGKNGGSLVWYIEDGTTAGTLTFNTSLAVNDGNYDLSHLSFYAGDDSKINPDVPEPSSLLALAGLMSCFGLGMARRRGKLQAAE